MDSPKILVVEGEKILAVEIKNSLQKLGYTVPEITNSGEEAIKKSSRNSSKFSVGRYLFSRKNKCRRYGRYYPKKFSDFCIVSYGLFRRYKIT
jgi:CheY-like chemotaxis protein